MSDKITNEDRRMIDYFWTEKGDLTRWSAWEERLPDIQEAYPELIKALADYEVSLRILNLVVRSIEADDNGED